MEKDLEWQIVSLEMDKYSKELGGFFEKKWPASILRKKLAKTLHHTKVVKDTLRDLLGATSGNLLVIYGSGYFHHYTYGLCGLAFEKNSCASFSYLHIDAHDDRHNSFSTNSPHGLNCSNFVRAINNEYTSDCIWINQLSDKKGSKEVSWIQQDVYLSIDLDVTARKVVPTEYNRGELSFDKLAGFVQQIKRKKNLIGADIVGYAIPDKERLDSSTQYTNLRKRQAYFLYASLASEITGIDLPEFKKCYKEISKEIAHLKK